MYFVLKLKKSLIICSVIVVLAIVGTIGSTVFAVSSEKVQIPILMYHSILQESKYHGDYVISPDELEKDMIFLKENSYTPITASDLLNYTKGLCELPEKPIILSFDDGYYNNYLYAFPLAQKYNMKIVISPIAYWSEVCSAEENLSANYSHCTWDMINEMSSSGLVEIGNHSYNLHSTEIRKGIGQLKGELYSDYKNVITTDITKAQNMIEVHTQKQPILFVYPFGAVSENTPKIIDEMGFKVTFSCEEKISTISKEPHTLQNLGRFLRPYNKSAEEILKGR